MTRRASKQVAGRASNPLAARFRELEQAVRRRLDRIEAITNVTNVTGADATASTVYLLELDTTATAVEVVIGTLVIPAIGVSAVHVPSAHCSVLADDANARPAIIVREGSLTGTPLGASMGQSGSASARLPLAIAHCPLDGTIVVSAGSSATYVVTLDRISGTGDVTSIGSNSSLGVLVLPQG